MEETKKNDKGYHSKPLRVKDEVKKFFNVRFKEVEVKFIKAFWDIMKMDVMRFLGEFHRNGVFPKGSQSGGGKQVGRL